MTNPKDLLGFSAPSPINDLRADLFGFPNYRATQTERTVAAATYRTNTTNTPATPEPLLAIADISDNTTDRSGIEDLPGTKTEIEAISKILTETKKGKTSLYLQNDALEEAIKSLRNTRLLHIATHGFFETSATGSSNPLLRSGLLMAGAAHTLKNKNQVMNNGVEDGILTAFETMSLDLGNVELVVLSACETGLGEVKNGEGVYGLQRAFIVAGTRAVIISLWKVNDEATQKLMTQFYKNWLGGMEKKEAFRKAQMTLKKEFNSPYYWGAFVMIGN